MKVKKKIIRPEVELQTKNVVTIIRYIILFAWCRMKYKTMTINFVIQPGSKIVRTQKYAVIPKLIIKWENAHD